MLSSRLPKSHAIAFKTMCKKACRSRVGPTETENLEAGYSNTLKWEGSMSKLTFGHPCLMLFRLAEFCLAEFWLASVATSRSLIWVAFMAGWCFLQLMSQTPRPEFKDQSAFHATHVDILPAPIPSPAKYTSWTSPKISFSEIRGDAWMIWCKLKSNWRCPIF